MNDRQLPSTRKYHLTIGPYHSLDTVVATDVLVRDEEVLLTD